MSLLIPIRIIGQRPRNQRCNVSAVKGTVSAIIPAGYSEGDQEYLRTGSGDAGTWYKYEWKAVVLGIN